MSETQDPPPPKKDKVAYVPGQPLPRLWKTEPEPEEDSEESLEQPNKSKKKASKEKAIAAPTSGSPGKPKAAASKPAKPKPKKKKVEEGKEGEKRVLLEETPAFDTIESRQRARLAMGGLLTFCVLILGWIVHGMIFSGSGDFTVDAVEMPAQEAMAMLPGPKVSREPEARYMLDRARDYAKREQIKEALAMLKRVVSVYKGTQVAGEAQTALDRAGQGFPLFTNGPYVAAEHKPVEVAPAAQQPPNRAPAPVPARPAPPPGPEMLALARPGMNPNAMGPTPAPAPPSRPPPSSSQPPLSSSPPPSTSPPPSASQSPPASQPPPGPGEVAVLIPANAGEAAMPPAGGHIGNDGGVEVRAPRKLPTGFTEKPEAGRHESGWPLVIVGERDGGTMVLVPGGTFMMGSDRGKSEDGPAHAVRLSTYYIDRYEITNRQFRTFLDATHYHGQPPGKWLTDEKLQALPDAAPAVFVSYHDAEAYALWALKRLPTEAQWEMAARSTDGRRYPWGDQPVRWSRPRKFGQVDPVMSFSEDVSPFGVFDMAGNAMEWVRDWYDPRYFDKLRDKTTDDPTGPPTKRQGIQRVVKGASKDWLVYDHQGRDSDSRLPYLGFRCSLAVEGGEASANIVPHTDKPDTPKPGTTPPGGQAPGGDVPF